MQKRLQAISNPFLFCAFIISVFLAGSGGVKAADFKGAAEVLREAAQAAPKSNEKVAEPKDPFREKLKAFQAQATNLPPAEAATQWLELVEEFQKASAEGAESFEPGMRRTVRPVQFQEVLNALPPPATWGELEKAVEARPAKQSKADEKRELGMRLVVHTLTKNTGKRAEDLKALDVLSKKSAGSRGGSEFTHIFTILNEALLSTMDDPEAVLRLLESQLSTKVGEYPMPLHVPNLVVLVGPQKAEAFFRKAFTTSRLLQIEAGTATHKLGTKIALEMVEQMPHAQWQMVNSLESVELFEAMDKKFNQAKQAAAAPATNNAFFEVQERGFSRSDDSTAKLYYFLGLIARDRISDAVKVAKEFDRNNSVYFPPQVIKQMERAGLTQQLNKFFATLLKDNPEAPFWREYVQVAAHAGHPEEALALVRKTTENKDLSRSRRAELKRLLPTALLANDEVEAGIAELRLAMTEREPANRGGGYSEYENPAMMIAKIGKLLDRKEWIDEGIETTRKKAQGEGPSRDSGNNTEVELADFLSELNRGPEAEDVLLKALTRAIPASEPNQDQFNRYGSYGAGGSRTASVLGELLKVYYRAGRFEDVVKLLDEAEYWGIKDVAEFENIDGGAMRYSSHHSIETPLQFYAASALAKNGKKQEARVILERLLNETPGLDRLYELLIEQDGTNALARLDELFARDQFEERPLIWKAHVFRTQNKLSEAEAVARKAISIDPSDGEQGPGDRMRAYAELAEIREARGDKKEADFFRGAVAAIRESEMADRLHEAGLLKRAVKMYQDSLTHFADAYCIQSRLAIQLADLGQHAEAEEHYRKAYELMPESFGRVESHCFGCERAFDGERAQSIAEKVFTQLAQKTPQKPQVHYLLGYLREAQERSKEALDHYRQAVKLDPDYLNAWQKISLSSHQVAVPAAERDTVVFNLIRLDPRRRHVSYDFNTVSDLATLWNQVAQAKVVEKPRGDLYPLAASKKKIEEKGAAKVSDNDMEMYRLMMDERRSESITPAGAVSQNGFIRAAGGLISNSVTDLMEL